MNKNVVVESKQQYISGYKSLQTHWKTKDKELLLVGRLAYWTYWISKLAEKTHNPEEKRSLFNLKRNGLLLLSKSNYVQLRKYVPNQHKKLCSLHSKKYKKQYVNIHKFIYKKDKIIKECSDCQNGQEHYFSLYSVAVLSEIEDAKDRKPLFVMYCPYDHLKEEFPKLDSLEPVKKYYGSELCTIDIDKKAYKLDLETFKLDLIIKYFSKNYNELSDYLEASTVHQ